MPPFPFEFELEFFAEENGEKPVATFLSEEERSNPALAARTKAALQKLEDGRYHRPPNTKELGNDIYELRIAGNNNARVLFFYGRERRVIYVHAFKKQSQKTPRRELEIALTRMRRYRQREGSGGD